MNISEISTPGNYIYVHVCVYIYICIWHFIRLNRELDLAAQTATNYPTNSIWARRKGIVPETHRLVSKGLSAREQKGRSVETAA